MVIEIISVKAVGFCSKHRKNKKVDSLDILTYEDGSVISDKDIHCLTYDSTYKG